MVGMAVSRTALPREVSGGECTNKRQEQGNPPLPLTLSGTGLS